MQAQVGRIQGQRLLLDLAIPPLKGEKKGITSNSSGRWVIMPLLLLRKVAMKIETAFLPILLFLLLLLIIRQLMESSMFSSKRRVGGLMAPVLREWRKGLAGVEWVYQVLFQQVLVGGGSR